MIEWSLIPTIVLALILSNWINYVLVHTVLIPLKKRKARNVDIMNDIAEKLKQNEEIKLKIIDGTYYQITNTSSGSYKDRSLIILEVERKA